MNEGEQRAERRDLRFSRRIQEESEKVIRTTFRRNHTRRSRTIGWQLACAVVEFLLASAVYGQEVAIRFVPVTREVVEGRLNKYGGDDARRQRTLMELFAEVGCGEKDLSEQPVSGWPLPNVICTLPGDSGRTIIVGAHYDHVPVGDGVVDNWSGASLLPSLYQALKEEPRRHTYVFVGFSEEERGLIGSKFYVQQMTEAQKDLTDAMVNMDVLGLAPAEYWWSYADKRLRAKLIFIANQLKLPISAVDIAEVGTSDSVEFGAVNIPSITIHSLSQKTWDAHILHTRKDTISEIRMDDYYQTYRLVTAYLAFLDYSTFKREPVERKSLRKSGQPK